MRGEKEKYSSPGIKPHSRGMSRVIASNRIAAGFRCTYNSNDNTDISIVMN